MTKLLGHGDTSLFYHIFFFYRSDFLRILFNHDEKRGHEVSQKWKTSFYIFGKETSVDEFSINFNPNYNYLNFEKGKNIEFRYCF